MFGFVFFLVFVAGCVPLALAIWRDLSDPEKEVSKARWYTAVTVLLADVLGLALLALVWQINGEALWFSHLGQSARFWTVFFWKLGLFLAPLVVLFMLTSVYFRATYRRTNKEYGFVPYIFSGLVAVVFAGIAPASWNEILLYLNQVAVPNQTVDPIFGQSVNFYLFSLNFYNWVYQWLFGLLGVVFVFSVALAWLGPELKRGTWDKYDWDSAKPALPYLVFPLSLIFFLTVWGFQLDKYNLMYSTEGVVAGAGYTDVHARIPAFKIMMVVNLLVGLILLLATFSSSLRRWYIDSWKRVVAVPGTWLGLAIVVLAIWPILMYVLKVKPNEITAESQFIEHNITMTRQAYGLDPANMREEEFPVASELTNEVLEQNQATLRNVRLWDPRALLDILTQTQEIRGYYSFSDVDVDRYQTNQGYRQVMISTRELDKDDLPSQARVWVNTQLKYTHGYGIAVNPVNTFLPNGNPDLWVKDVPPTASVPELEVKRPEIYFGHLTNDHVYVKTTEQEFDYPLGDDNAWCAYEGNGGIPISSFWRKLVFGWMFDSHKLLLSGYFTDESRIMFRRNVKARIRRLAPFLTLDIDSYKVIDEGRLVWICDAYTTSTMYPYSENYEGVLREVRGINYIRNSVKVVLDAYNGTVDLYVFDETDPIIMTYWKIFPQLFKPASEMPAGLRQHIRYPEDLFHVQAEMYGTYHMDNIAVFYNREDKWNIAQERYRGNTIRVEPYYVILQLPDMEQPEFVIMIPFTLRDKPRMTGWMSGLCDGENYGKLVAYKFPKGQFITGPMQVESKVDANPEISQQLTLWDQRGSEVIRGNLLVLPLIGNVILCFEPIYLQAETAKIPTLTRVVSAHVLPADQRIVWGDTFSAAQRALLEYDISLTTLVTQEEIEVLSPTQVIRLALKRLKIFQQYFGEGKFSQAGQELESVLQLLEQHSSKGAVQQEP